MPSAEQQADELLAQAIALIQDQKDQNADLALEKLDRLHRELDPVSAKRPVVEELIIRVLLDDSQERIKAAFTLKNSNEGRESQQILASTRHRFDRVAQLRPDDATLQDRVKQSRDQLDLTTWWVDFDAAYYAKQNDAQIAALTRIVEKNPGVPNRRGPGEGEAVRRLDRQGRGGLGSEASRSRPRVARRSRQDQTRSIRAPATSARPGSPSERRQSGPSRLHVAAPGQHRCKRPQPRRLPRCRRPRPGPPPAPRSQQLVPQGGYNLEIHQSNGSNQSHNSP